MMKWKMNIVFLAVLSGSLLLTGCKGEKKDLNVIDNLPQDGIYSKTEGTGGSYKDPIHGFFIVEPPAGFKIVERRDKTTITVQPDRPHAGEKLPRSWIQFKRGGTEIGAITRKTYTEDIETDFDFVIKQMKNKGAKVLLTRYVTIDGVKGGEYIVKVKDFQFHGIKYKKHGLDHSLSLGGTPRDYSRYQKEFLDFARSYRSLKPE